MNTRTGFAAITTITCVTLTAFGQGGDTPASANVIGALPFSASGTTIGYADDADWACPVESEAPDVFYAYVGTGEYVTIDLCVADYFTKAFVLDSTLTVINTAFGGFACDDDRCGGPHKARLECVPADGLIYIAVDGKVSQEGDYTITVAEQEPDACTVPCADCPAGATIEPNDCYFGNPDPNDLINGGCNSDPEVFFPLACGETICGTGYFDGSFRDTDWFEITITTDTTFLVSGVAEFASVVFRAENDGGSLECGQVSAVAEFGLFESCEPIELPTATYSPGLYWFFIGPDFTQIVDCNQPASGPPAEVGDRYWMRIDCMVEPVPCPWDFDGDGVVGFQDLLKVLSSWGPCPE